MGPKEKKLLQEIQLILQIQVDLYRTATNYGLLPFQQNLDTYLDGRLEELIAQLTGSE